jgi:subtilisin-like proprotein convertase family protein
MVMRTGSSDIRPRGHRKQIHQHARLKKLRRSQYRRIELEGLESRTLLATTPAPTVVGSPTGLTNFFDVTQSGNANSPTVAIDPFDPQKLVAVWGVDLSTLSPPPHTTAILEGAYSNDGGTDWFFLGNVSNPILDANTVDANPPTAYTQVTEPSVAFDGKGNVYVLALQTTGTADGALTLTKFSFSTNTPQFVFENIVTQWLPASDAALNPTLAVDTAPSNPPVGVPTDPLANNIYVAWASVDHNVANPNVYGSNFNPNRTELVVSSDGGQSFSGIITANTGGNFGPQHNSHPQLVINQNNSGQVTIGWEDFGTGATAKPVPFSLLESNVVSSGKSYQAIGATGTIQSGIAGANGGPATPVTTSFPVSVNVSDPSAITNLTVTLALTHPTDSNLSLVLQAPNGQTITLVLNQTDAAGNNNTGVGLNGANIGVFGQTNTNPGINVGTVFDDNATRNIFDPTTGGTNGNAAPYVGHFRPELGSLNAFVQQVARSGQFNGAWTLQITDFRAETTLGFLREFELQFTSGMRASASPGTIASFFGPFGSGLVVSGSLSNNYPTGVPSTPNGVGPGLVMAIDNTLGPDSPHQGRIYAAFVGYLYLQNPAGNFNPRTNTDIFMVYSDNGGRSWSQPVEVNDDQSLADGHSQANENPFPADQITGRTQFQPEIAVDQATGTLVMSWRDARDDAANARAATYLTTSIDGGQTFSPQTYANPPKTAIDAITGQTDILGPMSDNQSGGNPQRDGGFGFGNEMGLAVFNGQVYPIWAGNFNQGFFDLGTNSVKGIAQNIWYQKVVIAAGPRILSSSMGPIPLAEAASGTVSISVTFDRPVNSNTFLPGDVQVFYHDTTNGDPSIQLQVTGVTPVLSSGNSQFGYTDFTVTFNPKVKPDGSPSGITNYTGTYSYLIAPDDGNGTAISAPIWSFVNGTFREGDPVDQNADGASDENAVTTSFFGLTPGDVYAAPAPQPTMPITFLGAASILHPPFNLNTLPLIVAGPHLLSTSVPGGNSQNLIVNGTTSTLTVTFDRPMQVSTFTPSQVLQIIGPIGPIVGPITVTPVNAVNGAATSFTIGFPQQELSGTYTVLLSSAILDTFGDALDTNQNAGLAVLRDQGQNNPTITVQYGAVDVPKAIPAPSGPNSPGQVTSTITVPDDFPVLGDTTSSGIAGLQVHLNLTYPYDPDLVATLYHYNLNGDPLGSVPLFTNVGHGTNTANFTNTVFNDKASTPIQNGSAPFTGTYNPQMPLSAFAGSSAQGTWKLVIQNGSTTGGTGVFNSWSLVFQKLVPTSGLGEPGSDNANASFSIFTLGQAEALSAQAWTPVGPAAIGSGTGSGAESSPGGGSGRISGLAIDPSDPSGNTVYAAGASGGVWKTTNFLTTNFLTTNGAGPTWIPLTDFGPTNAINIGSIAVFPRNHDVNQSIIFAATGEGNTGTPGVGFLISQDGGRTWNLYDSSDNVDSGGNLLPIESAARNRIFVGTTAYKIVIDPTPTPSGQVVVFAALSGSNGGIWRSVDTGKTWQLVLPGQATDVVLDQASATTLSANNGTSGNIQVVFAALQGQGVFISPNQGLVWNPMAGGIGNPLIVNRSVANGPNVNPAAGPTPNGAEGRIVLAVPNATGDAAQDAVYAGWLYAAVASPDGGFFGLFLTKDFGQNWTKVRVPSLPPVFMTAQAIATNDVGQPDYGITGGPQFRQGNYNLVLTVDPSDPNIVYMGGSRDGNQTGLIRVDATNLWDAHSLVPYSEFSNDNGALDLASTGPAVVLSQIQAPPGWFPFDSFFDTTPYQNFIRNPLGPFVTNATLYVWDYSSFTNNGAGTTWTPFDMGGTDYHTVATMVDPTTGLPRLIFGNDQGVWSVLDNNGTFESQVGSSDQLAGINRNGNLQVTQFYYGAVQPSSAAAQVAQALFYGSAQDNGGPFSDPNVLNNGNISWGGPGGDAGGVATDQQGLGTVYQYFWPCCGGGDTDFFQVNGIGRTFGLLQQAGGQPTPDPQWPFGGGANFAVNPVNGNDVVISSNVGRIFSTTNAGVTWFDIGDPPVFNSPNSFSLALAYGAPDPNVPGGVGDLGNFIYVGTQTGQIYVTQNGGGGGNGGLNSWFNVSTGLDGSAVRAIVTDPARGSHDAYAVTDNGVYFIADSIPSTGNPTPTWINLTGNIHNLPYTIFGQNYDPTTDPNSVKLNQATALTSIAVDWRYTIPNTATDPVGAGFHPVLYVGSNSGVYQSINDGATWTLFPDTTFGAVAEGGNLPHVTVTDLNLSLGNIDVNTGRPNLAGPYDPSKPAAPDPDLLLATSYGRGSFAINLPPLFYPGTVQLDPSSVSGTAPDGTPLVTIAQPLFDGLSEITGFGNATRITIVDETPSDATFGQVIGGFDPSNVAGTNNAANWTDALGNFSIPVNTGVFTANGLKTVTLYATDDAGSVGNKITLQFTLDVQGIAPPSPPVTPTLALAPYDITGSNPSYTNIPTPNFIGVTSPNATVELLLVTGTGPVSFNPPVTTTSDSNGNFTLTFPNPTGQQGTFTVEAVASNSVGTSSDSLPVTFTILIAKPPAPGNFRLNPADDSGIVRDSITDVRTPHFIGTTEAGATVELFEVGSGTVFATATADQGGNFTIQLPFVLTNGRISLYVEATDPAGNVSDPSNTLTVTIVSTVSDYNYNTQAAANPALFARDTAANSLQWLVQTAGSAPPPWFGPSGTPFNYGPSNAVPFQGDFDGDGFTDLAYYQLSTATWYMNDSTRGASSFVLGTPNSSLPVVGYFDTNAPAEPAAYTIVNGQGVWTIASAITGLRTVTFGQAGDIPVPSDYNGVGYDEIAVYRPSTGQYLVLGPNGTTETFDLGVGNSPDLSSLVPVPGAYDNTAYYQAGLAERTEAAVYDPKTGVFTILYVGTQTGPNFGPNGIYTVSGFQPGDIPAPADYGTLVSGTRVGTGSTQAVVFRPTTGQFIGAGGEVIATFGASNNIPLAAPLSYRLPGSDPGPGGSPGTGSNSPGNGSNSPGTGSDSTGTGTGSTSTGTGSTSGGGSGHSASSGSSSNSTPPPASSPTGGSHSHSVHHKKPVPKRKPPSHGKKHVVHPKHKTVQKPVSNPKAGAHVVKHNKVKVIKASVSHPASTKHQTHVVDLALQHVHVNLRRSSTGKR